MQQVQNRAPAVPARELEADVRRQGYVPGFPPSLSRVARYADLTAFRRCKCPGCGARMTPRPFHRPADSGGGYRLILACACGIGEAA